MRSSKSWLLRGIVLTVLLLCLCAGGLAETGIEIDEDGGV